MGNTSTVSVATADMSSGRDVEGRVMLSAHRLQRQFVLDGRLDEGVYSSIQPATNFIQQDPDEGAPATHRTDLWVFFDEKNVYISVRCWGPPQNIFSNEMRRDNSNIWSTNDNLTVILDTFLDRRTAYFIQTNALGAVRDGYLPDENRNAAVDFDLVWDVRSGVFEQGWTTEMVIPFKSLRYAPGRKQVWGFNIERMERKSNEATFWSPVPASYGGGGIFKVSSAGTLVGIEAPAAGGILDIKPYMMGNLARTQQQTNNEAEFGFDAKYKVTKGVNLDLSYNTDFAQVEVDNQQLNLTRFSLFYPEKREFFLEGQSNFNFASSFGGGQGSEAPLFFFTRNIGLADGKVVPIQAAGRLTGRAGAFTVGAITVRTGSAPESVAAPTTFSAVRVRRDVLRRSSIGVIVTDRRPAVAGSSNQVAGIDAGFRFFQNVEINSYVAGSRTTGMLGDGMTYAGQFRYTGDLLGADLGHLAVGEAFNPELGFLTRRGFDREFGSARISRRPKSFMGIRKLDWEGAFERIANKTGELQTSTISGTIRIAAHNGDSVATVYTLNDDRPETAFRVAGAPIQPGAYEFNDLRLTYTLGPSRPFVGSAAFVRGQFYDGRKTEGNIRGRLALTPQLSVEPGVTLTWLDMPTGHHQVRLLSARTAYTVTPRMQISALLQHSSTPRSLGTNVRFRWEYRPGSDLYVVYTDGRNTASSGVQTLLNQSFAVKITRLLQF